MKASKDSALQGTTNSADHIDDPKGFKNLISLLDQNDFDNTQLLQKLPVAIYTCNTNGEITFYNEAAALLWGRDPELGKDLWCGSWKIYKTDNSPMPLDECPMAITLKQAQPVNGHEIVVERPDGKRINVLPHPRPLFNRSGNLTGAVNMLVDISELRLASASVSESEERFRTMANEAPIVIWMTDESGNYNFVNKKWSELTGREYPESIGEQWLGFVHTEDRASVLREWTECFSARKSYDISFRYKGPSDEYITVQASGKPRYNTNGQFVGYIGILQDITLQQMAKSSLEHKVQQRTSELLKRNAELRQSEERYHRMISEVQDYAIILLSADGIIENWNKGAEKIKGYKAEEIIGKSFSVFYSEEDRKNGLPQQLIERARKEGKALHEGWRVKKDGSRFWGSVAITCLHDDNNNVIGFSKVTRDLSDRKKSEIALQTKNEELSKRNEELRKSEERYHRMISEIQDYAIILLSTDGIVENWNKGAEQIKGYKAEEIIGKSFSVFYTEEDRKVNLPQQLIQRAREEGKANHEGWRVRKDGTTFWGNIVITCLHDDQDNVIGFSKVTRDLSLQKNSEWELQEKNRELEAMNQELASFAYVSSHDLQEPLRKIQTFASRILETESENLTERGKDYFQRMQNAALRMQTLIEDLLTYSRTNTAEKNFERTDLNILLEEIRNELKESIEEKKAVIKTSTLPALDIVPFQFRQLLINILGNALKFSKESTPPVITITADIVKGNSIKSSHAVRNKNYHHIAIADNGIGFEPEHSQRIFEVFQRLHGRNEYGGTGIGLAICKKIMENHAGIIIAESQLDLGATFHLYFPVK